MENIDAINAQTSKKAQQNHKSLAKFIYSVLVTFAIVFILGTFWGRIVFFPIKVIGISMQPTLNAQAAIACDTVYLANPRNISKGDIVVFDATNYTSVNPDEKYFIKRAIGLPGDTIYFATNGIIKNGRIYYDIYVNGVKLNEDHIKEPMWFSNTSHSISEAEFFFQYVETQKKIVLGSNQYYLLGDNRNNSTDSRLLGAITKSDFLGKVVLQIKGNQTIIEAIIQKIF